MSWLRVQSIGKQYEGQSSPALQHISFSLKKGEILAVIGPSGCGKSTLLQILAGLLEADTGEVMLEGAPVLGPSHRLVPGHEQIRMLKQTLALSPNMRVSENLRYFIMKWPKAEQERRVNELLALCRLEELGWKWPRELSGGQQQRLALAKALADKPALLLLDEPFSHLDTALKHSLQLDVASLLKASGTTAVWVTHDPQEAMSVADQLAVLQQGQLVQWGSPARVYRNPANYEVAQFFGPALLATGASLREAFPQVPAEWRPDAQYCLREWDWVVRPWAEGMTAFEVKRIHLMPGFWRLQVAHAALGALMVNALELPPKLQVGGVVSLSPLLSRLVEMADAKDAL
jgi:ABC-type Fe3+/spermidine/putrescine transport system ATPase subunit